MRNTKREGESAQAGFIHKALKMGLTVLEPFGDSERYDYVVNRGRRFLRVQVRSSQTMSPWKMYSVASCYKINHGKKAPAQQLAYTEEDIDILAVYLVPEDTWYIFPVAALRGRLRLTLYSKDHGKPGPDARYREAWAPLLG
jgi:hypothetical protein